MQFIDLDQFKNTLQHSNRLVLEIAEEFEISLLRQSQLILNKNIDNQSEKNILKDERDRSIQLQIDLIKNSIRYIEKFSEKSLSSKSEEIQILKNITNLISKLDNCLGSLRIINLEFNNLEKLLKSSTPEEITIKDHKILDLKKILLNDLNQISNEYLIIQDKLKEFSLKYFEYIERFKEETALLIKKYENKINDLTEKFENKFKDFELDQEKIKNSSNLLTSNIDEKLRDLNTLNERIQKIDLEFSNIRRDVTENIKSDLDFSKADLIKTLNDIILDSKEKSNEIENLHSDFKNIVQNAGIYKLTENYSKKSIEEKKEYTDYRKYTSWSIIAAILSTITVFAFAFWEQSQNISGAAAEPNYLLLISRLSISIMFFVLALYTSKQAAKHYECYQENHRTFLQLAALEPFMARMSEDEQKEIRKGLIPSYFNQGTDGKFAAKGDEVDMAMMFTFMDKLSNFSQNKNDTKAIESPAAENKPQI